MSKTEDSDGSRMGMWIFIYSEIMLFSGLFILYAVYYNKYTADFVASGKELDMVMGAFNTLLLLTSSFTVAAAITAVRKNSRKLVLIFLGISMALGCVFLINKYFEWGHKIALGIYPNGPELMRQPQGANLFFGLYYVITGLHGVHICIGLGLLAWCTYLTGKGRIDGNRYVTLENSGLYWHLVDLIWIFIFPLFYLIL